MKKQNTFLQAVAMIAFVSAGVNGTQSFTQANQAATPGSYQLNFETFSGGVYTPVSSLPVMSRELILRAYVENAAGEPALTGTAVFEYCSYKGGPPNDIERADEAPKEACESGIARWKRLGMRDVDEGSCPGLGAGNACLNFGIVRIPRDVGFRMRFNGRRSGIDSGTSEESNFTWTAAL